MSWNDVLIIYDRDGVLIEEYIDQDAVVANDQLGGIRFLVDPFEICQFHLQSGVRSAIATNQPGISRRSASAENVKRVNDYVARSLNIDEVFCCPHDDHDQCQCRKPRPGLLSAALDRFHPRLAIFIGDRLTDIEAGNRVGVITGLIGVDFGDLDRQLKPSIVAESVGDILDTFAAMFGLDKLRSFVSSEA